MDVPSTTLVAALDVKKSSSSWAISTALPMSTLLESVVAIRLVNIASNDIVIREPSRARMKKLKFPGKFELFKPSFILQNKVLVHCRLFYTANTYYDNIPKREMLRSRPGYRPSTYPTAEGKRNIILLTYGYFHSTLVSAEWPTGKPPVDWSCQILREAWIWPLKPSAPAQLL